MGIDRRSSFSTLASTQPPLIQPTGCKAYKKHLTHSLASVTPKCPDKKCKQGEHSRFVHLVEQAYFKIPLPETQINQFETLQTLIQDHFCETFESPCDKCGSHILQKRKYQLLFTQPPSIVVALGRLQIDAQTRSRRAQKIDRRVEISDIITLPDTTSKRSSDYELMSTVQHIGSIDSGHFHAHLKQGETFFTSNDSSVIRPSKIEEVEKSTLFFFKKLEN